MWDNFGAYMYRSELDNTNKGGTLAAPGPTWKAFVIESNQTLTLEAMDSLKAFAEAGLPVIISGGRPGYYFLGWDIDNFIQRLSDLLNTQNVHSSRFLEPGTDFVHVTAPATLWNYKLSGQ